MRAVGKGVAGRVLGAALATLALLAGSLGATPAAQAAGCQFVLGFAALEQMIPQQVGACLDNEQHNPVNGDGLQHTTNGLLVWRKADNHTAFTDGYRTWVNGPYGLEERLNSQRFPWEVAGSGAGSQLVAPSAIRQLDRFYTFINQRDFARAYALWRTPPTSYAQFVAGYRTTSHVDVAFGTPEGNSAAGTIGVDVPTVLLARQTNGSIQGYAGCYTVVTPDPLLAGGPQPWKIAVASIHALPGISSLNDPAARSALATPCPGHTA